MKTAYTIFAYLLAVLIGGAAAIIFIIYMFESGTLSYWMEVIDSNFETITTLHTFPEYWKSFELGDAL